VRLPKNRFFAGGGLKQEDREELRRENSRLKNELDLAQQKARGVVIQRDELRRENEKNKREWEELKKSLAERMASLQEDKAIAEQETIGTYIRKPSWQLYTDKDNGRCTERSSNGQPDSKWCVKFIVLKTSCVYTEIYNCRSPRKSRNSNESTWYVTIV
jgi:hypothetical protein